MEDAKKYVIRPAGRHVLTIGEDLIQDKFAALVELVKNAFDADSRKVNIKFVGSEDKSLIQIEVEDFGHGMTTDDVVNKWLVPSTNYKVLNRETPNGRIMQGRKGIGRYAASILGADLLLETVDKQGEKTSIYIKWSDFEKAEYLDQVALTVNSERTNRASGTRLLITGGEEYYQEWSDNEIKKLRFELKKLIPPKVENITKDEFEIVLCFENFYENQKSVISEVIEPYPILDLYDYRISGAIDSEGKADLIFVNNKIMNSADEKITLELGKTYCGSLLIDIRAYDRDKTGIENLINKGLKDAETGTYVSKLQARKLLNEVNGIGVYRNGFRIRPLGDPDFDWLKLNEQRIQNPTLKLGSNQVVGYVHIESEEQSNLEEKSARDGLKDNKAYNRLKELTCDVIVQLETRRYTFRRSIGLSNPGKKIEREFENLYDYSKLKQSVSKALKSAGLPEATIVEVESLINKEQMEKNHAVEEIRKAVAVYQGQATLGKIINIVMHEGRRPLNYFKNQIPNLSYFLEKYRSDNSMSSLEKIISLIGGIEENSEIFVNLFSRLDPLAAKKRETKRQFNIKEVIEGVSAVFENELDRKEIHIDIHQIEDIYFTGWKQDFYTIFTNLFDNSLYWISEKDSVLREISVVCQINDDKWQIDYFDSGPGIDPMLLESGVIFEPEFTTKAQGTGLGLSIAGEAAQRNGLLLTALQYDKGAHFRVAPE